MSPHPSLLSELESFDPTALRFLDIKHLDPASRSPRNMPNLDSTSKVLIIGAGPGGLVLAQILRNSRVPFEIFERDCGLQNRSQGWAVALIE